MKKHKWYPFWKTLKEGYDYFEKHRLPPNVVVCERRYVVGVNWPQSRPDPAGACPPMSRPQIAAFTPLPEPAEMTVASGNKMKNFSDAETEPTLAEIQAAKKAAQQSAATGATGIVPTVAGAQ